MQGVYHASKVYEIGWKTRDVFHRREPSDRQRSVIQFQSLHDSLETTREMNVEEKKNYPEDRDRNT